MEQLLKLRLCQGGAATDDGHLARVRKELRGFEGIEGLVREEPVAPVQRKKLNPNLETAMEIQVEGRCVGECVRVRASHCNNGIKKILEVKNRT